MPERRTNNDEPITDRPSDEWTRSSCTVWRACRTGSGTDLGVSSWRTVTQADINTFAKLTGDEQWIHVDPERAKTGLYGTTDPARLPDPRPGDRVPLGGLHDRRIRRRAELRPQQGAFPAPLKVGSRIRMHVDLAEVKDSASGKGAEAVYRLTYEVEGETKPCCVADLVFRYYN